jgi:xanthine/uracil/vitamin C permease (AzgA family)
MVLKWSAARVGALTWVLIFGGVLMLALGLVVSRNDAALGWGIAAVSIAAIAIGVLLIWLRSRMEKTGGP